MGPSLQVTAQEKLGRKRFIGCGGRASFAASSSLYRRLHKAPIANPTLLTIAALAVILASTGVPYNDYFEAVAVLSVALTGHSTRDALRGAASEIDALLRAIVETRT